MVLYFRNNNLGTQLLNDHDRKKRFETRNPIKSLLTDLKENDSDKENRKKKNSSRDTAEVDSRGLTDLLYAGW